MGKKIDLQVKIEKLLNHYLDPDVMVDKDKLEALGLAIDWVKTKHKIEQDQSEEGAFFTDEDDAKSKDNDSFLGDDDG